MDAVIVVVWDTELQTVLNWKPYKTNKLLILEGETIWPTLLLIINKIILRCTCVIFLK